MNNDIRSTDFRTLYGLTYNINSKQKKNVKTLWPLEIDRDIIGKEKTHAELVKRNEMIRNIKK